MVTSGPVLEPIVSRRCVSNVLVDPFDFVIIKLVCRCREDFRDFVPLFNVYSTASFIGSSEGISGLPLATISFVWIFQALPMTTAVSTEDARR